MDDSFNYSLNTPDNISKNILNQQIFSIIKNENYMRGGTTSQTPNLIVILIGIILIIVGIIVYWYNGDMLTTQATVQNTTHNNSQTEYHVSITYIVGTTEYSKVITTSTVPTDSKITIYYKQSDPNIIKLNDSNYSSIGIVLIVVGVILLISSFFSNNLFGQNEGYDTDSNLYQSSKNSSGFEIVYTK